MSEDCAELPHAENIYSLCCSIINSSGVNTKEGGGGMFLKFREFSRFKYDMAFRTQKIIGSRISEEPVLSRICIILLCPSRCVG